MDSRRRIAFSLLGLAFLLATPAADAQSPVGRLVGTIRDQSGAAVPGAEVRFTNAATNEQRFVISGPDGRFVILQVLAGSYTAKVEMPGFKTASFADVRIEPGQEYSLAVSLALGQKEEVLEVRAGADLIHATTPEVTNTVAQQQILDLPLNGRNPIELVRLQAGVPGIPTRTETAINGGRPTWTQVTQDGINIQDNFIRANALDFVTTRPTSDTVGEFTIVTNTQGADAAGGSSQVKLITPSGGNEFHGSVFEYNRNHKLSANEWFNNSSGVERPYLNRNQFGARLSGPILKDKLFFYGYYEGFRQSEEDTQNITIPRNADYASGVFRYGDNRSVNVLQLAGVPLDSRVQSFLLSRLAPASSVNNGDIGDGLNTGGFRFNQQDKETRNHLGGRLDYTLNPRHRFEASFSFLKVEDLRTDIDTVHAVPQASTDVTTKRFVGAWRWLPSPTFQNELRAGGNIAPVDFETSFDYGEVQYTTSLTANALATGLTHPIPSFQPQGRNSRVYQVIDNASWVTGRHHLQFGGSLQSIKIRPYNFAGILPRATFGFSPSAPANLQLTAAQFPGGVSAADLARANEHLAMLSGTVTEVRQSFQVKDRTSGYVSGIPNERNYSLNNIALFVQDNWNVASNVTVRAGLKWEYYTPLKEDDGLTLAPVLGGRDIRDVVLATEGSLDFTTGGLYKKDLNNFAPALGVTWDPFSDGKTAVRAAYSKAFVNEETIVAGRNAVNSNPGLDTEVRLSNLYARAGDGLPVVGVPTFKVPRTYADQNALSATSVVFGIDENLKQPAVHQFTLSVERQLRPGLAGEVRYVATLGRDLYRGIDLNQVNIQGEFLQDFLRARKNGFLAQQQLGVFDPAYNPAVAGSQPLTLIGRFGTTNPTVRSRIETGQPGGLADFYVSNRVAGAREAFLPNPAIYAADLIVNGGDTDYHGIQLELRRPFRDGFFGQVNYTFSKALSTSFGDAQTRFEPYLDNAHPEIERARSPFDVRHIVNGNFVYELPFGKGKRFADREGLLDSLIGGWRVSNILHWQSGAPFSILSRRGTVNRIGRSTKNTARSSLDRDQIKKLLGLRKQPDGKVYFIDPSILHTSGRAVGPDNLDNTAGFPGQVFFNPAAGELGNLQLLQFDGPSQSRWDLALIKRTRLGGRFDSELRIDVFNVTNTPYFFVDDELSGSASMSWDVNSTAFGRVNDLNQDPRIVQISARISF
jgi:hypothetical protein